MSDIRSKILNADDIPKETVTVAEWGDVTFEVRGMTARGASDFLRKVMDGSGKLNQELWAPQLIIACAYDPETGERVFEAADQDALALKASTATAQVAAVAARLSGLAQDDEDAQVEDFGDAPSTGG